MANGPKERMESLFTFTTEPGMRFTPWNPPPPKGLSREDQLLNENRMLKEKLEAQNNALQEMTVGPYAFGVVLSVDGKDVTVMFAGQKQQLRVTGVTLKVGDIVRASSKTGMFSGVVKDTGMLIGSVVSVNEVIGDIAEVSVGGQSHVIVFPDTMPLERGDRVVLDDSHSVAIRKLPPPQSEHSFSNDTFVTWDDIGGLEGPKRDIQEAIEGPVKHPELYKAYAKAPAKGILIYGPPGCGKTMLGQATASALQELRPEGRATGFIYVKGPSILNKYVGESEANVRRLFAAARLHKKRFGYPAVLFIDEADALLRSRDHGVGFSSIASQTVVPTFLAEMDGLEDSGAFVILATNRQGDLDPAVVRDGRIDHKTRVTRPDQKNAEVIFGLNLRGVLCDGAARLAEYAAEELFSEKRVMFHADLVSKETKDITLAHLVNGGLVAGIVEKASTLAIRRDREKKNKKPSGVTTADFKQALDWTMLNEMDQNHTHAIEEVVGDLSHVIRVRRSAELEKLTA